MDERGERLLDAHVAHELARLRGKNLEQLIDDRVNDLFAWFEHLRLGDAARKEDVIGIAHRYALNLRISGGISELAGEIARLVVRSPENAETCVGDVVSSQSFEEFTEKVASLDDLRGEVISLVARSEAVGVLTARVIAHIVTDLLRRAMAPASIGPLGRLLDNALPGLERRAADLLGRKLDDYRAGFASQIERHLRVILDGDALHELAEELWLHISRMRLSDALALMGEKDIEDFVVLCFEFWLRLRKAPYIRRMLAESIAFFYEKYGEESVADVISDMGVTAEMIASELKLLLVPLAEQAIASGYLERQLRLHLADFYSSEAVAKALGPR
jgi:hypothetical protein